MDHNFSTPFPQAVGDGGQGWGNAILYIFFSSTIRRKLFGEPCNLFLGAVADKLHQLLKTENETVTRPESPRSVNNPSLSSVSENAPLLPPRASEYKIQKYASTTTEATFTDTTVDVPLSHQDLHSSTKSNDTQLWSFFCLCIFSNAYLCATQPQWCTTS